VLVVFSSFLLKAQWLPTNGPFPQNTVKVLQVGTYLHALTDSSGIKRIANSKNGGFTWKNIDSTEKYHFKSIELRGATLFGASDSSVYKSSNHGLTWIPADTLLKPLIAQTIINKIVQFSGIIYALTGNGIYYTPDNGSTWGIFSQGWNTNVLSMVVNGDTVYVGTKNNGIYRSLDAGVSWQNFFSGQLLDVNALSIFKGKVLAGTNTGLFYSLNYGVLWTMSNVNDDISSFCIKGADIFATSSSGGGVFHYTSDTNYTWVAVNTGLANTEVQNLAVNDTFLYAATTDRVWKRPLSDLITFSIKLTADPIGSATLFGNGIYPYGSTVQIKADSNSGYSFDKWLEDGSLFWSDSVFTISPLYRDYDLVAKFKVVNTIPTLSFSDINLFPNPSDGDIILNVGNKLLGEQYFVYDVLGKMVLYGKLENKDTHIDLSGYQEGNYFLKIGNDRYQSFQLIKL
jgi:hypothetical protein